MDAAVLNRAEELKTQVPEALKKLKIVADLPACDDDMKRIMDFSVEVIGVRPENVTLLVTEDTFKKVVKHIAWVSEEKKDNLYYESEYYEGFLPAMKALH